MPKIVRIVWLRLILVLLGCGLLVFLTAAWLTARALLRPPRMTDAKAAWVLKRLSPADLGLSFAPTDFRVRDEATGHPLKIAAWWIPHPAANGRCAILIHGYADAKVGAIAWAPLFHEAGWNVLALDLRAHGESDGRMIAGGYFERHDVRQVIDELRASRPADARRLVLFGISYGAVTAAATAELTDDIAGVVLDSPALDVQHAAGVQARLMGLPGRAVAWLVLRLATWLTGADFRAVRPLELMQRLACPLMVIQPGDDPFLTEEDADGLRQMIEIRADRGLLTSFWHVPGVGHVLAWAEAPDEYERRVREFLEQCAG